MAKTVTAADMKERERAANEAGLLYIQMMEMRAARPMPSSNGACRCCGVC